jgi:hypothetical protein
MWFRRLLALVIAVGLVYGAWQARVRLIGRAAGEQAPEELRVACVRELAGLCSELDTSAPPLSEDAPTTVARFAEAELPFDVWVTLDPWPEIGANARERAGQADLSMQASEVLARSPIVLAAQADRVTSLEQACGGTLTWRCLGERAGQPWTDHGGQSAWGQVKVGLDEPSDNATGLLTLAEASASYFDDTAFNSQSLASADYFAWVSGLADAMVATPDQSPFERMLLTGSAELEFVGALESAAVPLLRRAPGRAGQIVIHMPEPLVTADVIAVGYGPNAAPAVDRVVEQLRGPLADSSWRVPGEPPPSEVDGVELPDDNGVPSAAVLERLQQTWVEITR